MPHSAPSQPAAPCPAAEVSGTEGTATGRPCAGGAAAVGVDQGPPHVVLGGVQPHPPPVRIDPDQRGLHQILRFVEVSREQIRGVGQRAPAGLDEAAELRVRPAGGRRAVRLLLHGRPALPSSWSRPLLPAPAQRQEVSWLRRWSPAWYWSTEAMVFPAGMATAQAR